MNSRSVIPFLGLLYVTVVAVCWYGSPVARAQPTVKPQTLTQKAEQAFKLQSYNEAIRLASEYLEQHPGKDRAADMERIVGLSQVGLKRFLDGYETLKMLYGRHPQLRTDEQVLGALAIAAIESYQEDAVEWVSRALSQYAATQNTDAQVQLLFRLAQYMETHNWQFHSRRTTDYHQQILTMVAAVLDVYDKILTVDGASADAQIRALAAKSALLYRYGYNLKELPRAKWPAHVQTKYRLDQPYDQAIEFERTIVRQFPNTDSAAEALHRIARTQEVNLNDFLAALKTYGELVEKYPRSNVGKEAEQAIARIKAPSLGIHVEGTALPGEKPKYRWDARNIKTIEFQAYDVDLFDVLKEVTQFSKLDDYPLQDRKPVQTWTIETGDKGEHQHFRTEEPVEAPLSESNAYIVVATGANPEGKSARVVNLMLVSRLAAILKSSVGDDLVFAADAVSGEPKADAEVLVQSLLGTKQENRRVVPDYVYQQFRLPDNGLLTLSEGNRSAENQQRQVICRSGKDYALVEDNGYFRYWVSQSDSIRVYAYTDRPVYRPLQTVNFKHILRLYKDGTYQTARNQKVGVTIYDARGNKCHEETLVTNEWGSISGSFTLPEKPVLGQYSLQVTVDNRPIDVGPGSAFRVEEYKKPEYTVELESEKSTYKVGDKIRVKLHAEYYFGGPVPNAQVSYTVNRNTYYHDPIGPIPFAWFYDESDDSGTGKPWALIWPPRPMRSDLAAQGTVTTDEAGNAIIEFESEPFHQTPEVDLQYQIQANVVDQSRREIRASTSIKVTHRAFYIGIEPEKHLYHPKDNVKVTVRADNANGKPVAFEGNVTISYVTQREQRDDSGKIVQPEKLEEISQMPITVDTSGSTTITFVPEKEGLYSVRVNAPDPYGGEVVGERKIWTAQGTGEFAHYAYRDLEMVPAKSTLQPGENLELLVTSRHENAYVLLTAEADQIYHHQVLFVPKNGTTVEIPVAKSWQPDVTLQAWLLRDDLAVSEQTVVNVPPVEDFLTVTLKAPKQEFLPREQAEIEVQVVDHQGNPVECELSLGAVDASIFYIQQETRGDIRKYFHGRPRLHQVRTATSYGFHPSTDRRTELFSLGMVAESVPRAAAPMAKAAQEAAAEPDFAEPELRTEFPDTVYWAAHVRTGSDGTAKATVRFPDSLTTWRLTAIAADAQTRVGEVKHEVITRKNIIVRLQAPRFFVERDRVLLSAIAHNYLDQEKVIRVKMTVGPELSLLAASTDASLVGDESGVQERFVDVTVPGRGEKRIDFLAAALHAGKVRITAAALTDAESDAMQQEFEVIEYGAEKLLAESGVMFGLGGSIDDATVTLEIPEQLREGSQSLTVTATPTVAGVMMQSLPYLLEYPYGCTEQTMSRFLPAVLTSHTLKSLGIDLQMLKDLPAADPQLEGRFQALTKTPVYDPEVMRQIIQAGVDRLSDFQKEDGGWGWWKNDASNPYISAYVVSGLALAARSNLTLPEGMLDRGVKFLSDQVVRPEPITRYPWQQAENASVRIYMLFAIAEADRKRLDDPKIREKIAEIFSNRDELNDYSRALLALTLHAAAMNEQAQIVLANIKDRAVLHEETQTASWGEYTGYYYWYHCGTEATSFSLRALLAISPNDPMIPQVVNWLLRHRHGTRWFNTKDTANVCYALAEYLKVSNELDPDLHVTIEIDGKQQQTLHFTRANLLTPRQPLVIPAEVLGTGAKRVTVRREGRGNLYWGAYASFFTKEDQIKAAGNEIYVRRQYAKLEPRVVKRTRKVFNPQTRDESEEEYSALEYVHHPLKNGDPLASGDLVEVTLEIEAKNNFEYMMFEDPKPAGCEPVELKSGSRWGDGLGSHMELRDEMISFFATYVNQGKHKISYRLRAEIPGKFQALPARAESMYAPLVKGNGDSHVITVIEKQD